jgi:hypothetical protein
MQGGVAIGIDSPDWFGTGAILIANHYMNINPCNWIQEMPNHGACSLSCRGLIPGLAHQILPASAAFPSTLLRCPQSGYF